MSPNTNRPCWPCDMRYNKHSKDHAYPLTLPCITIPSGRCRIKRHRLNEHCDVLISVLIMTVPAIRAYRRSLRDAETTCLYACRYIRLPLMILSELQ